MTEIRAQPCVILYLSGSTASGWTLSAQVLQRLRRPRGEHHPQFRQRGRDLPLAKAGGAWLGTLRGRIYKEVSVGDFRITKMRCGQVRADRYCNSKGEFTLRDREF